MNHNDLQGWSSTQLFNFIQLGTQISATLHNYLIVVYEKQQQQIDAFIRVCDQLFQEKKQFQGRIN